MYARCVGDNPIAAAAAAETADGERKPVGFVASLHDVTYVAPATPFAMPPLPSPPPIRIISVIRVIY